MPENVGPVLAERTTNVLVIGAGAAGMYAAAEARRAGAEVIVLDKSMVGRGGATIMAQMTVAAAVAHAEPDSWECHYRDTIAGGKGISDEPLAALMCHDGPARLLETWERGVNWASDGDRLDQVVAPGHSRRRCCYVGALQTGSGVSRGLRKELRRQGVEGLDNMLVAELVTDEDGAVVGAVALDVRVGEPLVFWADTVVLACGGLTEMYARNSASVNMTGDAYALALGAGAELVDMEMVQFFPIANLSPRLIGLDPIMWDPFRYRLGGRLLNGDHEEFLERYAGVAEEGSYTATRDVVAHGILSEVAAGRGSPHGGAWLDFTDVPREEIRAAFPAAVERLEDQGIDLSERAIEVAPTAHYTIGGIRVDLDMATCVAGLYAAGEAVGGQHGANRLSGNALTETFVFGARAGEAAAAAARTSPRAPDVTAHRRASEVVRRIRSHRGANLGSTVFLPALRTRLQAVMSRDVGPVRDATGLAAAGEEIELLHDELQRARVAERATFNLEWSERIEFGGMLRVAEAVRRAALARQESRGAHQRQDRPAEDPGFAGRNTIVTLDEDGWRLSFAPVRRLPTSPEAWSPAKPAGARVRETAV